MSSPLQGEPERQAVAPIAGVLYQIWQSVLAWIKLEPSEVLYLEGAEDFDVIGLSQATSVQVRHTAAPITLGSAKTIKAIGQFWNLHQKNPDKKVAFRYLTTSHPGIEAASPFGQGLSGIDFWEGCRKRNEGVEPIKNYLLLRDDLDSDLRLFLSSAPLDEIHRDLIQPIAWLTRQPDTGEVQNAISEILIAHGEKQLISPSAAESVGAKLYQEVCDTITRSEIVDRVLTRSKFLAIFEQATTISVPVSTFQALTSLAVLTQSHSQLAEQTFFIRGPVPTNSPPTVPDGLFERTVLIESVRTKLERTNVFLLFGSAGMGKTTIAAYVARFWQSRTFWIDLRDMPPESVSLGLRRLTTEISQVKDQCIVILDDIDLRPNSVERFEPQLASLLLIANENGFPVLLTSQREFPQRFLRRSSNTTPTSFRIPPMSHQEVRDFCNQQGCPASEVEMIVIAIYAKTKGHPTLVHALIIDLKKRGWHDPDNSLSVSDSDTLQSERDEARQQLVSGLSDNNRELLYRLTLIEDRFRKDHALKIGELEPSVPHPGDCFGQIVGPWIESSGNEYFQVSPLLSRQAEEVWSADKCLRFHESIAEVVLRTEPRTTIEANTILRHAWKARSTKNLYRVCFSLTGADTEIADSAFEGMLWFAAISLSPGEILFQEDHALSHMLRSLQYRIARQAHKSLGDVVLVAWIAETEKRKANLFEAFELSMNQAIFSSMLLPPNRLFSILSTIQEVERHHQDLIRNLEDSLALAPSEAQAWNTTNLLENATLFALSRYKDVQEFADLVDSLEAAQDPIRGRVIGALAISPSTSTLLVDRVWMNESDKPNPDWARCLTVFKRAVSQFSIWELPILVDASIRAITVITDEYLGQTATALDEFNRLTKGYRRDSGLLRAAKITLLSNLKRSDELILVARDSIPLWENELDPQQIYCVFSLRLAGITATGLHDWTTAAELFEAAHAFAHKKRGYTGFFLGLQADAAFANWNAGAAIKCINEFSEALKQVEVLAVTDADASDAFRLRKLIGVCFLWILKKYERAWDRGYEPPPGACSKLDVSEEVYKLPDSHPDLLWWMLTQIDYYLGTNTGIDQELAERLEHSPFPGVAPFLTKQRIQRSLSSGSLERLPEEFGRFASACSKRHSQISNLPHRADSGPEINFQAEFDNTCLALFSVALLRIAGSGELLQSTFVAWEQFCEKNSEFESVRAWMNSARTTLLLDASTCEHILLDSTADLWSQRIPAAISIVRMESVSATQLLQAQAGIVSLLDQVSWLDDIGSTVAELFASGWRRSLRFRGQFFMPNLTIPELERACNLPDGDGLSKVSRNINAASQAANRRLAVGLQELVDRLASRRHA